MTVYTVTTASDEGFDGSETTETPDGTGLSLREALGLAVDGDSIVFDLDQATDGAQGGAITLSGAELSIEANISIDGDVDGDNVADVTIDANDASRVFVVSADDVTLLSLNITGGRTSAADSPFYEGGGILIIGTSGLSGTPGTVVTIRDCSIYENYAATSGGGIATRGAVDLTVEGCSISDNTASQGRGGGVRIDGLSTGAVFSVSISNSSIISNATGTNLPNGGGISIERTSDLTLDNVTIAQNVTTGSAGGAYIYESDVTIQSSTITGNSGLQVEVASHSNLVTSESIFAVGGSSSAAVYGSNNNVSITFGGVTIISETAEINGNSITVNTGAAVIVEADLDQIFTQVDTVDGVSGGALDASGILMVAPIEEDGVADGTGTGGDNVGASSAPVVSSNVAAEIGGDIAGSISEDETGTLTGTLTISDTDGASEESFVVETIGGTYGDLTMAANGDWGYDLDEANGDVQALAAGDTLKDTITVHSNDDTTQDIVITVTGVNDAATFGGDLTGAINEDGTTTTGTATVSDVDTGEGTFSADTIDGANGTLVIATNGAWTYTIDNSDTDVQGLAAGDTLEDTVTVESDDDTTQDIVIIVTGVNDLPASTGGSVSLREDNTKSFTSDNFNFADVDSGDALVSVRIDSLPDTGTLKLSGTDVTAGDVIAVADIANLTFTPVSNDSGTTSFTYSVNDGTGFASSVATMSVTVRPVNDAPNRISLTNQSVQETAAGVVIGTVSGNDVDDKNSSLVFTVDDSRFTIDDDNQLRLVVGQALDYEIEQTVTVTLTATDDGGASRDQEFTITVTDVNEVEGNDDGQDSIDGSDDDDFVRSRGGDDRVSTGNGRDTIDGGDGNDDIDGGGDDDLLRGGQGHDLVNSGSGNDLVWAGRGDDGDDTVNGDEGADTLGGGVGDDLIDGGDGDDVIFGREGEDTLFGGEGNDLIYNGEGSDSVNGGNGNDTLWGSAGDDDTLTGGDGEDTFVFTAISGDDVVADFDTTEDILDLRFVAAEFGGIGDVQAAATETSQNGVDGLVIDLGGNSVFLVGLTLDDLSDATITL